jgi:hypothetical protein
LISNRVDPDPFGQKPVQPADFVKISAFDAVIAQHANAGYKKSDCLLLVTAFVDLSTP